MNVGYKKAEKAFIWENWVVIIVFQSLAIFLEKIMKSNRIWITMLNYVIGKKKQTGYLSDVHLHGLHLTQES